MIRTTLAALLLVGIMVLSGCGQAEESSSKVQIEPPPDIPQPVTLDDLGTLDPEMITEEGQMPEDEIPVDEAELNQAVEKANQLGFVLPEEQLDQPVTRAELVAMFYAFAALKPANDPLPTFEDVSAEHPYYGAIEAAVRDRRVDGIQKQGVRYFQPDNPLSRAEFFQFWLRLQHREDEAKNLAPMELAVMTPKGHDEKEWRFENLQGLEQVEQSLKPYVAVAYRDGVVEGMMGPAFARMVQGQKPLNPQRPLTRRDVLLLLHQQYQ